MLLPFGNAVIEVVSIANISATTAVIYIGIATVIANICWSKILSKIEASKAAVFLYTVPVMTIIIGFLWLRELPSLISCLGGAIPKTSKVAISAMLTQADTPIKILDIIM